MALDANTLLAFSESYLHSQFDNPVATPKLHMEMWDLCCSKDRRVAIAAPRRHAKSTAVTLVYNLACIVFREKQFILIVSDTEDQAKLFLGDIRKQVMENIRLQQGFLINPEKPLLKDSKTDIEINFLKGPAAKIMALGSGQNPRGAKWENKRPDLIICDDLENSELVMNAKRRKEHRRWLRNDLEQALSSHGQIRVVGTILHFDSTLNNLMPNNINPKEDVIKEPLREYKAAKKVTWRSVRYRAHDENFENILWPESFGKDTLLDIRQTFADDNDLEGYAQEFLNEPIHAEDAFFPSDCLLPMEEGDWKDEKTWYCGVDLAVSTKQTADWSAFVVVGLLKYGDAVIPEVIRDRIDSTGIVDTFFKVARSYPGVVFVVEKGQIWRAIEPIVQREQLRTGLFFDVLEIPTIGDKRARARPMQHRVKAKAVRIDHNSPWYAEYASELTAFDRGKNDDQVDATANVFLKIHQLAEGQELEDMAKGELDDYDEYEDDDSDDYDEYDSVSSITGY